MPPHAKVDAGSRNELFLASFEKIVVWPLLVDFGYFSNYIWLQAAQEPTNPVRRSFGFGIWLFKANIECKTSHRWRAARKHIGPVTFLDIH